jgi:hypothetical protein
MSRALFVVLLLATGWSGQAAAHAGHTDRAPWDACDDHKLGDVCSWENDAHDQHIGSCREIGGDQMCVRNRPVIKAEAKTDAGLPRWLGATLATMGVVGIGLALRRVA